MMSWQTVTNGRDRLACRWSEAGERIQYSAPWMREAASNVYIENVIAPILDFTKLSPFGKVRFQTVARPRTN